MWLPLKNIKMGRLHLAITVLEDNEEVFLLLCSTYLEMKIEG